MIRIVKKFNTDEILIYQENSVNKGILAYLHIFCNLCQFERNTGNEPGSSEHLIGIESTGMRRYFIHWCSFRHNKLPRLLLVYHTV